MGMTIDMTDFEKGFKALVENAIPAETKEGLFQAGNELLRDAIKEAPQAPKDKGDLWGSAQVNKAIATKDEVSIETGFNIAYAARWHEAEAGTMHFMGRNPINWTTTKGATHPGPKYLEKKMAVNNGRKYLNIVGEYVKKLLGG